MTIEVSIIRNKQLVYSFSYIAKKSDADAHDRAVKLAENRAKKHGITYDFINTKLMEN
jgi:hypothetical protein